MLGNPISNFQTETPGQRHLLQIAERVANLTRNLSSHRADLGMLGDRILGATPEAVPSPAPPKGERPDLQAVSDALDDLDREIIAVGYAIQRVSDL